MVTLGGSLELMIILGNFLVKKPRSKDTVVDHLKILMVLDLVKDVLNVEP